MPVASLGEGVRSFLLWDQIFAYSTMLFLALLQLARVAPALVERCGILRLSSLVIGATAVVGPGSACILLNWAGDEFLTHSDAVVTEHEAKSSSGKRKAAT